MGPHWYKPGPIGKGAHSPLPALVQKRGSVKFNYLSVVAVTASTQRTHSYPCRPQIRRCTQRSSLRSQAEQCSRVRAKTGDSLTQTWSCALRQSNLSRAEARRVSNAGRQVQNAAGAVVAAGRGTCGSNAQVVYNTRIAECKNVMHQECNTNVAAAAAQRACQQPGSFTPDLTYNAYSAFHARIQRQRAVISQ